VGDDFHTDAFADVEIGDHLWTVRENPTDGFANLKKYFRPNARP
jgi:hypothetical protein